MKKQIEKKDFKVAENNMNKILAIATMNFRFENKPFRELAEMDSLI